MKDEARSVNTWRAIAANATGGELSVTRFIVISFVFLGWAFYQLSGGSKFDPEVTRMSRIEAPNEVETALLESSTPAERAAEINVEPVTLELATAQEVLTPKPRLNTTPARVVQETEARLKQAALEVEEEQQIILPSLIQDAVPSDEGSVTPVDFSQGEPAAAPSASADRRIVSGSRVNVRGGPGTDFQIVNRLVRGDEVEILEDPGNGWVRLRPVGGGTVGWMADFLLTGG